MNWVEILAVKDGLRHGVLTPHGWEPKMGLDMLPRTLVTEEHDREELAPGVVTTTTRQLHWSLVTVELGMGKTGYAYIFNNDPPTYERDLEVVKRLLLQDLREKK